MSYLLYLVFLHLLPFKSSSLSSPNRAMLQRRLVKSAYELNNVDQITPATYSNRANLTITPIIENAAWSCDRSFFWNNIDVSCRSTLLFDSNTLFVHSPVHLDVELKSTVDRIIVEKEITKLIVLTTNYEHLKFVPEWYLGYGGIDNYNPNLEVKFFGCPGIRAKVPDVVWDGEIGGEEELWDYNVLEPLHVSCERLPGTDKPFFNEVVFFMRKHGVFVATDLYWNYPKRSGINPTLTSKSDWGEWELAPSATVPLSSRLWKFGMDKVYQPVFNNVMVKDKREFERVKDTILAWGAEVVVPSHGDIIRGKEGCEEALLKHFGRM